MVTKDSDVGWLVTLDSDVGGKKQDLNASVMIIKMRVYSQCTRGRCEVEEAAVTDSLRSECQGTDFRVSNTAADI